MSTIDKYYEKYKAIEASIQDVPPRPRVSCLLYLGYSVVAGSIIIKEAHWSYFVVTTLIFLYIYNDVGKRIKEEPRGSPD